MNAEINEETGWRKYCLDLGWLQKGAMHCFLEASGEDHNSEPETVKLKS